MDKNIKPAARIKGKIKLLGDKSISHRAAILASLCKGDVTISNYSTSDEFTSTLNCLRQYGVQIEKVEDAENTMVIHGQGLEGLTQPEQPL